MALPSDHLVIHTDEVSWALVKSLTLCDYDTIGQGALISFNLVLKMIFLLELGIPKAWYQIYLKEQSWLLPDIYLISFGTCPSLILIWGEGALG